MEANSFIPNLQKQAMSLATKRRNLSIVAHSAEKFAGLPEHCAVSQMIAITDMQIGFVKKSLVF